MKIDRYRLFEPLILGNKENPELLKELLSSGRSIHIVKYGFNLDLYRPSQIIKAPWGQLLEVRKIETHDNLDNVNLPTSILSKSVVDNIKKYLGKFDIIELFPICSLIFFTPTPRYNYHYIEPYNHCGIIYNDKVYESWDLLKTKITDLVDKEQYLFDSGATFIASSIVEETLFKEIITGCSPIEFVSRCIGLSKRRFNEIYKHNDNRYFTKYLELYNYLRGRSTSYGSEY